MSNPECHKDLFNMFCGKLLGEGSHRKVFECLVRPDLVVKVEHSDFRYFANVFEMQLWSENAENKDVSKWLAPVEFISPDGRILLQKRCDPLPINYKLPARMPEFLCDFKRSNYGIFEGRLVCVDYGITYFKANHKLIDTKWAD